MAGVAVIAAPALSGVKSLVRRATILQAGVAELADAQDLKSWVPQGACGFDSRPRHSSTLESQRAGVATVLLFFVVDGMLMATMNERRGIGAAWKG